ncbi:hypothetical protein IG631_19997 [Alternaria alternata]|jgi:hypothetical protein|nr:hypothetical protein IG631_19997 [Alternaria alternata]
MDSIVLSLPSSCVGACNFALRTAITIVAHAQRRKPYHSDDEGHPLSTLTSIDSRPATRSAGKTRKSRLDMCRHPRELSVGATAHSKVETEHGMLTSDHIS